MRCRRRPPATWRRRSLNASSRRPRAPPIRRGSRCTGTVCSATRPRSRPGNVRAMATGAQLRVLCDRLVGAGVRRHAVRRQRTPGRQQVPGGGRPSPAGRAEHALPGPAAAPQGRPGDERRLPGRRAAADRHLAPVLRRQQPGRDHGRHDDRGRAGLPARGARRLRHELRQRARPAEHRLLAVRVAPGGELHRHVDDVR